MNRKNQGDNFHTSDPEVIFFLGAGASRNN
jgi:hypothetical protein